MIATCSSTPTSVQDSQLSHVCYWVNKSNSSNSSRFKTKFGKHDCHRKESRVVGENAFIGLILQKKRMHSSRMRTVLPACWPYPVLSHVSWGSSAQFPPPEADPPWMQTPLVMWLVMHAGKPIRPMDRRNDTHLWKHYLAPNFICGR